MIEPVRHLDNHKGHSASHFQKSFHFRESIGKSSFGPQPQFGLQCLPTMPKLSGEWKILLSLLKDLKYYASFCTLQGGEKITLKNPDFGADLDPSLIKLPPPSKKASVVHEKSKISFQLSDNQMNQFYNS
ncbi:hypothetical protein J0A68_05610 [Algoriphagus sp. H41]|uniref:Uncharacterized protein n=1 Tax=Algoriphagus oliviformis TaxID=2811231 RepID=A0ABS3C2Q6_9BACT|nr:hypothetical protein [Algoriphagus oliviformis]MBN7810421.1 hypothetical protein [Algoriphagus oliviformis]